MGLFFDEVPDNLVDWIKEQKIFFVATAPLHSEGHVNVSAKGHNHFKLLNPRKAIYYDLSGSTNETSAHLYENGRVTIMFIAFEGPPRVLRLFAKGKVFLRGSPEFHAILPAGEVRAYPGIRSVIQLSIHKVGTSCGFSIPYFDYKEDRMILRDWAEARECADEEKPGTNKGMRHYWALKNLKSIDGLPGIGQQIGHLAEGESLQPPFSTYSQSLFIKETPWIQVDLSIGFALGFVLCYLIQRTLLLYS